MNLYNKYRPQKFSELVDQEPIVKTLKGALTQNKIAHAYLFSGPRGTGKTSCARILAKAVNCENLSNAEPCNQCRPCLEIKEGKALDLIEIDAASNRGIDEIRDLREKIKTAPSGLKYKVYIIDEVHMLTKEAFSALLKTLEEPPSHAIFILATTEIHKIPQTIISRCQRFDFRKISKNAIKKTLSQIASKENFQIEDGVFSLICEVADGSLRDAVSFLDQLSSVSDKKITLEAAEKILGILDKKFSLEFLKAILEKDNIKALTLIEQIIEKGGSLTWFCKNTIEILRKILLTKIKNLPVKENEYSILLSLKVKEIKILLEKFNEIEKEIKFSSFPQLPFELFIAENINQSSEENLSKEKTEESWIDIISKIKSKNISHYSFLLNSCLLEEKEEKLMLGFPSEFYLNQLKNLEFRNSLENTLSEILGKEIKLIGKLIPKEIFERKKPKIERKIPKEGKIKEILDIFKGELIE